MKASTAENRARLFQAEALVPQSIGDAFRAGRVQTQTSSVDASRA